MFENDWCIIYTLWGTGVEQFLLFLSAIGLKGKQSTPLFVIENLVYEFASISIHLIRIFTERRVYSSPNKSKTLLKD